MKKEELIKENEKYKELKNKLKEKTNSLIKEFEDKIGCGSNSNEGFCFHEKLCPKCKKLKELKKELEKITNV